MYKVETQTRGTLYFTQLPKGTYFLGGYRDESDKGKACYYTFDTSTCLIPITDLNDKKIIDISRAGQEIK